MLKQINHNKFSIILFSAITLILLILIYVAYLYLDKNNDDSMTKQHLGFISMPQSTSKKHLTLPNISKERYSGASILSVSLKSINPNNIQFNISSSSTHKYDRDIMSADTQIDSPITSISDDEYVFTRNVEIYFPDETLINIPKGAIVKNNTTIIIGSEDGLIIYANGSTDILGEGCIVEILSNTSSIDKSEILDVIDKSLPASGCNTFHFIFPILYLITIFSHHYLR